MRRTPYLPDHGNRLSAAAQLHGEGLGGGPSPVTQTARRLTKTRRLASTAVCLDLDLAVPSNFSRVSWPPTSLQDHLGTRTGQMVWM
jgi:hypothetical protein